MAAFTTILPCDNRTKVTLLLFKHVSNSSELQQSIRKGDIDASLIKAETVLDKFQVLTATNKAVNNKNTNNMTTRSIHTEIIYCMSCTKNISDSLMKFGIKDTDTTILAVVLNDNDGCYYKKLLTTIKGEPASIEELSHSANEDTIKKNYKIRNEDMHTFGSLLNAIVSRIATKDFISF